MKLEETILQLRTILPAKDFIVTGSFVLAKYGLMSWATVADLDIILVEPETSTIETLNRFMKDFPAKTTAQLQALPIPEPPSQYTEEELEDVKPAKKAMVAKVQTKSILHAIFVFDKVKIDVFIENDFNEPTLTVNSIKYTTIPHIIKAKQSYGRMKDWLQCRDMAKVVFDGCAFQIMLDNDWKNALRNDYPDK